MVDNEMADSLAGKIFKQKSDFAKFIVKKELSKKLEQEKISLIIADLGNQNIDVRENFDSIKELKKYLKSNVSTIDYNRSLATIRNIESNLDSTISQLENGSTNAFSKFMNSGKVSVLSTLSKSSAISLAGRTALILAPTVTSKLAVSGVLTGRTIYKLIKNSKHRTVVNREYECDKILDELEVTRDDVGNIIDTRFDADTLQVIKNYFKEHDIAFTDTGYMAVREKLHSLGVEDKKELCSLINGSLNNKVEHVEERIDAKKKNFFDHLRTGLKLAGVGVASGGAAAAAINSVDPALVAAPLNGALVGNIVGNMTDNKLISFISGSTSGLGFALSEYIPVIGEGLENIYAGENIIALATAGAGIGLASTVVMDTVSTIKNVHNKFKTLKNRRQIMKLDQEKYADKNREEYQKMQEILYSKENSKEETVIFNIVKKYVDELGVDLRGDIRNINELRDELKKLNNSDKKKVEKLISELQTTNKNNPNAFLNAIRKAGNLLSTTLVCGLASLSVYDILKGGEFLPAVSADLFKNVDGNLNAAPEPEKPEIKEIKQSDSNLQKDGASVEYIENKAQARGQISEIEDMIKEEEKPLHEKAADWFSEKAEGVKSFFTGKDSGGDTSLEEDPVMVANKDEIKEELESLTPEQLTDFIYYYNDSKDVNHNSIVYKAVGELLQEKRKIFNVGPFKQDSKLDIANKYIEEYNKIVRDKNLSNEAKKELWEKIANLSMAPVAGVDYVESRNEEKADRSSKR